MAEKAVRVRIEGRVQGVFFRAWTEQEATARRLRGWVRNRADGSVEALFAGSATAVDDMLGACWRGPSAARVDAVRAEPADFPDAPGFRQAATT